MRSIRGLHAVAPRAMLSHGHVVVPVVAECPHVAELALDSLTLDEWVSRNDTRLPVSLALRAVKRSFVNAIVVAFLTSAARQSLSDIAIHIDLQHPVSDLVSLLW